MADDKKDLKPEEQTKNDPAASEQQTPGKDTPPAKEAVDSPGPAQEKTDPADKGRSGNVIDLSGAMIDKIVAEKEKALWLFRDDGSKVFTGTGGRWNSGAGLGWKIYAA